MTKDWKLFYRGVMTHITYTTWYKQKIGLGAEEDEREVKGHTVPELSLSQKISTRQPQGQFYMLLRRHSGTAIGGDNREAQENNMHYTQALETGGMPHHAGPMVEFTNMVLETEAEGRLRPWGYWGVLGKGKVRQGKQLRMGWFEKTFCRVFELSGWSLLPGT